LADAELLLVLLKHSALGCIGIKIVPALFECLRLCFLRRLSKGNIFHRLSLPFIFQWFSGRLAVLLFIVQDSERTLLLSVIPPLTFSYECALHCNLWSNLSRCSTSIYPDVLVDVLMKLFKVVLSPSKNLSSDLHSLLVYIYMNLVTEK